MSDPSTRKPVTLALQGGGSHGAFTWGVLDRLLEEPRLDILAISGTSAGAINAAVLASGWASGSVDGAKKALHDFWRSVSRAGKYPFSPFRYWGDTLTAAYEGFFANIVSPYDNPVYANALAPLLAEAIDFERLRACRKPEIFICATNVLTNERRVFGTAELSVNALLASACLPTLFRAVDIDGEHYWDGGYLGNPALAPLLRFSQDLVIVEVNALKRNELPTQAHGILDRINEITFNASLVQEIDAINTLTKLIESGQLINSKYQPIRFHSIAAEKNRTAFDRSKTDTDWDYLSQLHRLGRAEAQAWIEDEERFGKVGIAASVNIDERFVKPCLGRYGK